MMLLEDDQRYVVVGFKKEPLFDIVKLSVLLKQKKEVSPYLLDQIIRFIDDRGMMKEEGIVKHEEGVVDAIIKEKMEPDSQLVQIEQTSMIANVCEHHEMKTPRKIIKHEPEWSQSGIGNKENKSSRQNNCKKNISSLDIEDCSAVRKLSRQLSAKTQQDILDQLFHEYADNIHKYESRDWPDNTSLKTDGTDYECAKKHEASETNLQLERHNCKLEKHAQNKKRGRPKLMTSAERLDLQRQYHKFYNILFLKLREEIDKNIIISHSEKEHLKAILSRDFTTHRKHNFKICNLTKYLNRPTVTDRDTRCKAIMCSILVKMFTDVEYWEERVAAERLNKIEPQYLRNYAKKVQDAISYYNLRRDAGLVSINDIGLWD